MSVTIAYHYTLAYRLTQILRKLNQGQKLDPQHLADEFGVNLRTIQRDLNERFAFLPLKKVDGRYHLDSAYLDRLSLRDLDRFAALAGVRGPFPSLSDDFLRDITEVDQLQQKQAENCAQLRETQRRMQDAQHLGRIGYWQTDLGTNPNSIWWSDEVYEVMGMDRILLGSSYGRFLQRLHPDDREAFDARRDAAMQAGLPLNVEFRVITAVGEVRWIHLIGQRHLNAEGKQGNRLTGVVQEITERKRAELVLVRSTELLNRTGALARVGGWEMDVKTMTLFWSEEIFRIHEVDPDVDVGLEQAISFYVPEVQPVIRAAVETALQNGTPWDMELQLVTATGWRIWVRTEGHATLQDGKVVRLIGALQDITEIKAAEDALRLSNQELEAFSYSVSHDLRSPLNTISGFSQLLEKQLGESANDKTRHYVSRIQAGVAQMGQLIADLLSLAQVSRTQLRSESVDLSVLAHGILDKWQARQPQRQVTLHIESGLQAHGDAGLVRVVMDNLLGNAWKFSSQQAQAEISVGQELDAAGKPVFFVRDNGAGFNMAYADKLFKPFQRLHAASEFPGTGMGLATVSRVIGRHGGQLWSESAPGSGATFFFTLPKVSGAVRVCAPMPD
jgi:PAS domain S-box-containing protein